MMSDGGQQEGATWEAALVAAKYKLNNLTFILDLNGIQIDGFTREIMPVPDMAAIYKTCGWNVVEIDAHNYEEIDSAFEQTEISNSDKPNMIIATSTPGKGVDFMENKYEWHDWRSPDAELVEKAKAQLQSRVEQLSKINRN
jgi:transketolase